MGNIADFIHETTSDKTDEQMMELFDKFPFLIQYYKLSEDNVRVMAQTSTPEAINQIWSYFKTRELIDIVIDRFGVDGVIHKLFHKQIVPNEIRHEYAKKYYMSKEARYILMEIPYEELGEELFNEIAEKKGCVNLGYMTILYKSVVEFISNNLESDFEAVKSLLLKVLDPRKSGNTEHLFSKTLVDRSHMSTFYRDTILSNRDQPTFNKQLIDFLVEVYNNREKVDYYEDLKIYLATIGMFPDQVYSHEFLMNKAYEINRMIRYCDCSKFSAADKKSLAKRYKYWGAKYQDCKQMVNYFTWVFL